MKQCKYPGCNVKATYIVRSKGDPTKSITSCSVHRKKFIWCPVDKKWYYKHKKLI